MGVHFVACTFCVICPLHESCSRADQCEQDKRPTYVVGKNGEKIWTQIVESMRIRIYTLKTSQIVSTKPPESSLASMTGI